MQWNKICICFLGKYRKHIHRLFPSSHQTPNVAVLLSRFKPTSTTVRISIIRIALHDFNCTVAENCIYSLKLFEHSLNFALHVIYILPGAICILRVNNSVSQEFANRLWMQYNLTQKRGEHKRPIAKSLFNMGIRN